MISRIVYLTILVVLLGSAVLFYNPPKASVSGVTPTELAESIASKVQNEQDNVIVHSAVAQVSESSNLAVVSYVVVLDVDPELFSATPQTQAEVDAIEAAFGSFQGSVVNLLRLTGTELMPYNPTVVQMNLTIIFLDGTFYQGTVTAEQLTAVTAFEDEAWMATLALTPGVPVPGPVWDEILALPEVQKVLSSLGE